jgi:DNA-binding MarR family transcriptional regulator
MGTLPRLARPSRDFFSYEKKVDSGVVPTSRPDGHEYLDLDEWQSMNALLLLNRRVLAELDRDLRQEHGLGVTDFDVLITLYNAPERRLRMSSLGERVMLSPAGVTHLVTRLERDGLVRREVDPSDRRKWYTVLTRQGDELLKAARRTHNATLRRGLLRVTTPAERRTLQRLWTRLSESRAEQPPRGAERLTRD